MLWEHLTVEVIKTLDREKIIIFFKKKFAHTVEIYTLIVLLFQERTIKHLSVLIAEQGKHYQV